MIPIFIIILKRAANRRKLIEKQFMALNLQFEWFDAIDGKFMPEPELNRLIDHHAVEQNPTWLTRSAIGCALSHYSVYKLILERKLPYALVLEDDILLKPGFAKNLPKIAGNLKENEIISLYAQSWQPLQLSSLKPVALTDCSVFEVIDIHQPITAAAYLITFAACQSMVEAILPIRYAADVWGEFYKKNGFQNFRYVYPEIIDISDAKSSIEYISNERLNRLLTLIDRFRVFPFYQLLKIRRKRNKRKMKKVIFLPQPSFKEAKHTEYKIA